jgi:hypothetical protein
MIAMIAVSALVMFGLMYLNTYEFAVCWMRNGFFPVGLLFVTHIT